MSRKKIYIRRYISLDKLYTAVYNNKRKGENPESKIQGGYTKMKVQITKEDKKWLTLAQAKYARQIVLECKEDTTSAAEYAAIATEAIMPCINAEYHTHDYFESILKASASICENRRTEFDYFGDGTEYLNIWISITAETSEGFIKFGALLTDIWNIPAGGELRRENAYKLYKNSWVRYYRKVD